MPIIIALERMKQEDFKFQTSLGYIAKLLLNIKVSIRLPKVIDVALTTSFSF